MAAAHENALREQLSDLVSRGLLVVEIGPQVLVQECDGKVTVRQSINLQLKDREYIEKLERENKEMREIIERLQSCLK